jgi:SAM-dependent methyltransferase
MNYEALKRHIKNENDHWWFKARREIIKNILKKLKVQKLKILDFGAGSGTNIEILKEFGNVEVYEKNKMINFFLKKKFKKNKKIKIIDNYKNKKYDLILAADVIEHIKKDNIIVKNLWKILKKNGKIIITVPSYQFLFSKKDEDLKHYRRYNINKLKKLISKFKTIKCSYFNFFLFIPLSILILIFKLFRIQFINSAEKTPNKYLNKILYLIFKTEKFLINRLNFPFGLSIIFVGEK